VGDLGDAAGLRRERARALVGAAVCAFAVWAASPALTGRAEPWDAEWPYYTGASLLLGAALGLALPGRLAFAYLGAWLGQLVALLVLPGHDRAWFLVGAFSTAIGSLVFLAGHAAGSAARRLAGRSEPPD
jgi:hypothetical protein